MTTDVVTLGEAMALFQPLQEGPLSHIPLEAGAPALGVGGSLVDPALIRAGRPD